MYPFGLKFLRLLIAMLILFSIACNLIYVHQDFINFFSYFTILSNLFVAGLYIYLSFFDKALPKKTDYPRLMAVIYLIVTGVIYQLLLSGSKDTVLLPWISFVLHKFVPIVVVGDFLINSPKHKMKMQGLYFWIMLSLIYMAYTLIRGFFVSWYPYLFLDPRQIGYVGVFAFCAIVTVMSLFVSFLLIKYVNLKNNKR